MFHARKARAIHNLGFQLVRIVPTAGPAMHNQEREVEGLLRACRLPGKRRPLLLTLNPRDRIREQGTVIEVQPAWEWLTWVLSG